MMKPQMDKLDAEEIADLTKYVKLLAKKMHVEPVETEQELLRPSELLVRLKKLLHIESSITLASGGSPLS